MLQTCKKSETSQPGKVIIRMSVEYRITNLLLTCLGAAIISISVMVWIVLLCFG